MVSSSVKEWGDRSFEDAIPSHHLQGGEDDDEDALFSALQVVSSPSDRGALFSTLLSNEVLNS